VNFVVKLKNLISFRIFNTYSLFFSIIGSKLNVFENADLRVGEHRISQTYSENLFQFYLINISVL